MYKIMFNDKPTPAEFSTYFIKYKSYLNLHNEKKKEKNPNIYDKDIVYYIINNTFIYRIT
jgi:hypothetical protein